MNGINRPRENDEAILFTPEFHRTTLTGPGGIEAVLIDGLVVSVHDGEGSRPIPENGFVVSAAGKAAAWVREHLRPGGRAEVRSEAAMVIKGRVVNSPSDPTGERPLGDALLVFLRPPAARAD